MKRVLVTGGGGFLGGEIVRQLMDRGCRVRSLSRRHYPDLETKGVDCVRGDVSSLDDVKRAMDGCDTVFHVAAKPGVWGPYEDYYRINTLGTENVITACVDGGIEHLIYTSTPSVVHGGESIEGADETLPYPEGFETAYPETKALAEKRILAANSATLKTVALRPHLIWGPGDNHLIPRIVDRAKRQRLRLVGPPFPKVDSTYVVDAARAHLLAADELAGSAKCAGRAYFISQGEPWPTDKLINGLLHAKGHAPCHRVISARTAYVIGFLFEAVFRLLRLQHEPPMTRFVAKQLSTCHWYDIGAARRDFGYSPQHSIETALILLREHHQQDEKPS